MPPDHPKGLLITPSPPPHTPKRRRAAALAISGRATHSDSLLTHGKAMNLRYTRLARSVRVTTGALILAAIGCPGQTLPESIHLHLEGAKAAAADDHAKAVELLTRAIEEDPNPDVYFDRARSLLALGRDDEAIRDCDAGLALDSEHQDLQWLRAEAEKPEPRRFQGVHAEPPSYSR